MENHQEDFFTFKGYQKQEESKLTSSMEDYLEMISRILEHKKIVRTTELAQLLHVKPSSASKMVAKLGQEGYVIYEKYGYIQLTQEGKKLGTYFMQRHQIIHDFLCVLNHSDNELEQVEKIEHFLNRNTIQNLYLLTQQLKQR